MSQLINSVEGRAINSLPNYILQIRFPYFKKLKKDSTINFDFPFTVLVGPNGSGKSSTLQALYGCPAGYNVAHYWFSTAIDPITESGGEAYRYIYKYKPAKFPHEVEISQTRVRRAADPDYWESNRPRKADGMAPMPVYKEKHAHLRSKTRWKKMEKNVVYIDFRAELSAFDKFFYFGSYDKRSSIDSPQDFLRYRSERLRLHIEQYQGKPLSWHRRVTESIVELSAQELKWVNQILGKQYISAKIVTHNLFNNDGYSIIFANDDSSYSEAVAGSGEVSIVNCVTKVLNAKPGSLILLDEPEVSLHPGAQTELRNLLLSAILNNGCQVVMSTHSEHFVQGLPNRAIKLFQYENSTNTYSILNECSPEQAFIRLGSILHTSKTKIYVEDELAKSLLTAAIEEIDPESVSSFEIIPYPGGADTIVENLLVHFAASETPSNDIVFLDGDMLCSIDSKVASNFEKELLEKKFVVKQYSKDIPETLHQDIDLILAEQIGRKGDSFKLPLNGGNHDNSSQKLNFKLKMLDLYHQKFKFMNVDTPEEFIWRIAEGDDILNIDGIRNRFNSGSYKERFESFTKAQYKDKTDAKKIFDNQLLFLNMRDSNHPDWVEFKNIVQSTLSLEKIVI
ncbi:ATP-dependent endonuclease [Vibrio campbellii]